MSESKEDQLERLAGLVDRLENINTMLVQPIPDVFHVQALRESLPEIKSEVKEIYLNLGGEDVWKD